MSFLSSPYPEDQLFGILFGIISRKVPGAKIAYKEDSLFHRFLGVFLFWSKYKTMTSTWFKKVWFPTREYVNEKPFRSFKVLAHEYVHLIDHKEHPLLFPFLYLFPQDLSLLAIGAVLAIFSKWYLLFLLAFVFLLPFPAPFRSLLEMRGYSMNLAINIWRYGSISGETMKWLEEMFTGWNYYKMDTNISRVRAMIADSEKKISNIDKYGVAPGDVIFDSSDCFEDVYGILTGIEFSGDDIGEE